MYFTTKYLLPLSFLALVEGYTDTKQRSFPPNFMFGVGSSAYQVEGAWDTDGKGESIWDRFMHEHPELIADGVNGDVASDSYHQYKRDVEMLRELGVDHYRFSISWPRILPTGFPNKINEKGLEYYDALISELIQFNIEPMVTLYHFDLPQSLQALGGWANPLVADWFEDYAGVIFKRYADKVKYWITINQPHTVCVEGYGDGVMAPGLAMSGVADYMCVKNVLVAHARAYRLYQSTYKSKYKGNVGIALAINWADPFNNKTENTKAAEEFREFTIGIYAHPIWSPTGDYPQLVKDIVAKRSLEQGFTRSRLPALTGEERRLIKGSADFLGMNHYTTFLVKRSKIQFPSPSWQDDVRADLSYGAQWRSSQSAWLKAAPFGIYKAFLHINKQYDFPQVFITEHGWSSAPALWDQSRVDTLRGYAGALLFAMEDGARVWGYTHWSLADNVEWTAGTSERFGLYQVDFSSPQRNRTARLSALVYRRLIQTRLVEEGWKPDTLDINVWDRRLEMIRTKTEL